MVTHLHDCFSLPLKTGCIIIGIIFGIENIVAIIGFSVKAHFARFDYERRAHSRVMESSLVILAILNFTMLMTDFSLLIGAMKELANLLYSWVIMYSVLKIMSTIAYIVLATICIFMPTCKTALAVTIVAGGWITFSIYCFCVLVVYSYFKELQEWSDTPVEVIESDIGHSEIVKITNS